ncbi:MAG: excinuclease ABC subunit UvrC [Candidatus Algichlamydia australiensis]|nr:excinuclease ABC subunit UvrC [Chlamydiales bacterium]
MEKHYLTKLPGGPGVYLMRDAKKKVLYVGKAKNLRARVKQYFATSGDEREMIPFLIAQIDHIETISTLSEKEALLLENNLIKQHKPKYNVLLKDDKNFISLMINHKHKWPMIKLVRYRGKPKRDGIYFGPYTSTYAARQTLELMQKIFPMRQCSDNELRSRTRPCLLYGIKRCIAPCVGKCSEESYADLVTQAKDFLKGRDEEILALLKKEMESASDKLEFERAGSLKKTIAQVLHITQSKNTSVQGVLSDCDVLGFFREVDLLVIVIMIYRDGRLIGSENFPFKRVVGDEEEIIASFLLQHYQNHPHLPKELLIPLPLQEKSVVEELLHTKIHAPQKGNKKKLIELAAKNAKDQFSRELADQTHREDRLLELEEKLSLTRCPVRIEIFDTSNIAGTQAVASQVAYTDGIPDKKRYRLFNIRGATDDYAAMHEVLTRRLTKAKSQDDLPDLIILDGGKGQLNVGLKVFEELEIASCDIIALTKEDALHTKGLTQERVFLPHKKDPIVLDKRSSTLFFLQEMRDEAHRFAITHQKKTRNKNLIKSRLDSIEGIGSVKKKRLLQHFGSVKRILDATEEELLAIPGITKKDVKNLREKIS